MPAQWKCVTSGTTQNCYAVATSTPPTGATFQETLFIAGVIIFFLSFISWRQILRPVSEKRDYGL